MSLGDSFLAGELFATLLVPASSALKRFFPTTTPLRAAVDPAVRGFRTMHHRIRMVRQAHVNWRIPGASDLSGVTG